MPLAWGHTRLLETDWRLITQESPGFIHGECQKDIEVAQIILAGAEAKLKKLEKGDR